MPSLVETSYLAESDCESMSSVAQEMSIPLSSLPNGCSQISSYESVKCDTKTGSINTYASGDCSGKFTTFEESPSNTTCVTGFVGSSTIYHQYSTYSCVGAAIHTASPTAMPSAMPSGGASESSGLDVHLTNGAVAGIVIGMLLAGGLITACFFYFFCRSAKCCAPKSSLASQDSTIQISDGIPQKNNNRVVI